MFNAGATGGSFWQNSEAILLDFIQLTPADDVLRLRVQRSGKIASAGLSLQDLDDGDHATYRFPDVGSADVTLAIENGFTVVTAQCAPIPVAANALEAFTCNCPTGKAVGAGVRVETPDGQFLSSASISQLQVIPPIGGRVAVQANHGAVRFVPLVYCMTNP